MHVRRGCCRFPNWNAEDCRYDERRPGPRRLIDHVLTARDTRTPLCLRGHGSKDFYGEVPRGEPLDMTPLTGISHYEPTELVVTARAGTSLSEL
jgi:glycolate oxidase FAD binding subunit